MNKKERALYIILFVIWIIVTVFAGIHHEPWGDEAQSWLIARDNNTLDMIINVLRYEGHPALWYLILRFLHLFGFPYDAIYIVPIFFSCIGVYLLMFKTKLPTVIKCLFPFTYFIMYQYSVIARSYCLLLPLLMFITVFYKNRLKNPIVYSILLILLMSSETYSFIIASILFLFFIYDIYKSKQYNIKAVVAVSLVIIIAFLTILYMWPQADCITKYPFEFSLERMSKQLVHGYFKIRQDFSIPANELIVVIMFYLSSIFLLCKNRKQVLFFLTINGGIILTISGLLCHYWHNGYIFVTYIFTIAILYEENGALCLNKYVKSIFYTIFVIISAGQILWTSLAILYDYLEPYSEAKLLAGVIKTAELEKYGIVAIGYNNTIAVQPYFNRNIYTNLRHSYYDWDKESENYGLSIAKKYSPVMIIDNTLDDKYFDILNSIDKDKYNIYVFNKTRYFNGQIHKGPDLFLYVSKDIDIR